jgi:outer membrane receptor for ferrienterochelin and colicin
LLVNRSRLDVQGVELAAALALSDTVDLDAAVTFTEAEVRETDTAPRNRPRWRASGTLSWRPRADLALTIGAVHVGSVRDSSIPTGDVNLDPFTRVDLGARWFVTADAELYLAVQNALDTRYEEFVGFEASGILPRVGARLRF